METNELIHLYKAMTELLEAGYQEKLKNYPRRTFQSPETNLLASALSLAQGSYLPLFFNRMNPRTQTEYVDIDAIFTATRKALEANQLAVTQLPITDSDGTTLYTKLVHSSGQYFECLSKVTAISGEMKVFCSLLNETKKQALLAILGIAPRNCRDDDDCEEETKISRDEQIEGVSLRHNYGNIPDDQYKRINKTQLDELDDLLSGEDMKDVYKSILKSMRVSYLSEIPQDQYQSVKREIYRIRETRKSVK